MVNRVLPVLVDLQRPQLLPLRTHDLLKIFLWNISLPINPLRQHNSIFTLEKLHPLPQTLLQIQINKHITTIPHPTDDSLLSQQTRRKMDMIPLHALQALWVLEDGLPGCVIGAVDDGGVFGGGSYGSHFHLNSLDAVTLICSYEVFGTFGGF
jgi:hypothetical protein